ncbi:MAG: rod shape-determining protein [Lachnospiraceae bacterium]|nr:rod shape-determining protein [Lachnospiraceae bacterium]MBQ6363847.1 rod shape-determining protein [Lachnospiraceae bacterium]MBR2996295.1 rod shape-determining protein [Lachnospiraceae bacterium]
MKSIFRKKTRTQSEVREDIQRGDVSVGNVSNTFGIDLGTYNIKLYSSSSDKISVQKNMVAIADRKRMIAYGNEAYEMFEKAPANIRVSGPINNGVIADINNMELMIRSLIRDEQGGIRPGDYYIAIPTDVTEVERRAFYDLIKDAGVKARRIMGVEKAIADGLGMGIDVKNSQGVLVVDVGYDTTEISVLSLGGIVLSRMIKVGGRVFDTSIVNGVRREFNLVIGMKTAEAVRLSIGDLNENGGRVVVFGRDIVTGLPMERTLTSEFVEATLEENFHTIVDSVRVILERTPPELSADIYRHGLFMTGGASQQKGLAQDISNDIRLNVNLADYPVNSCALGLAQVIKRGNYRSLAYTIEGLNA